MFSNLKKVIANIPGWYTNRKIIVFESDDWGSIRMSSNQTRETLIRQNVISAKNVSHFDRYDSLESNDDLEALFEVLSSVKDHKGNHPIFTAINVVANPAFEKIKDNNFTKYFYEPFTETLIRYPKHDKVFILWKEGYEQKLFSPQFHGREHLNVTAWMKALQEGKPKTQLAFEHGITGIDSIAIGESKVGYQAAFDIGLTNELKYLKTVIQEGTELFRQLMGYQASYFVPTNGPFNLSLEESLYNAGIKFITLEKIQKEPLGEGKYKTHLRWLGKKNKFGITALSRNASFEPSSGGKNWLNSCLKDIEIAFKWRKPAIISTHRVNYVGFLDESNRKQNLLLLGQLFNKIKKTWPEVEFMTSVELGDIITQNNQY